MIPLKMPPPKDASSRIEWNKWANAVGWALNRLRFGWFSWTAPTVPAATFVDTVVATADTVGLRVGMALSLTPPPTIPAFLLITYWVETDDSITVRLTNITGGDITPPPGTWGYLATGP